MIADSIAISEFEAFSKIDRDLNQPNTKLNSFLEWKPSLESFEQIIQARKYPTDRGVLVNVLKEQYSQIPHSPETDLLIESLASEQHFTVCTAHQPSLLGGPAFVISKAISTIKLARQISQSIHHYKITPVFVIGSEDHDIEELNHTYLYGEKIVWDTQQKGPVGRFSLEGIENTLLEAERILEQKPFRAEIIELLREAYDLQRSYAQAFQYFLIRLLDVYGILVINMDHPLLKKKLVPLIQKELVENFSKPLVLESQSQLAARGYEPASHAREINFFYFDTGFRDRIEKENGHFTILGSEKKLSASDFLQECMDFPERLSPNVILRPVYQELILPNLAYVGGGGELAYWLERKNLFHGFGIPFPMLVRRDSFMIIQKEDFESLKSYQITVADLAKRTDVWINELTERMSSSDLTLRSEELELLTWMDRIKDKVVSIDPTLGPTVEGEKSKLSKSIEYIEKKILKAEKQKLDIKLNRARKLKEKLMPDGKLTERKENILTYYGEYGPVLLSSLLEDFNPLDFQFKLVIVE
jgi:bacillithiol synthase